MNVNLEKISEAQAVADNLSGLPKEALLYIAGYAEGFRDSPKSLETNGYAPPANPIDRGGE